MLLMRERKAVLPAPSPGQIPAISAASLWKSFPGSAVPAVEEFSLDVQPGEVLALLGPSGCGKTTALRLLAGLERPDAGRVEIAGRPVVAPGVWVPPEKRAVGMVFQDYALFPHLTVRGNVAYGLNRLPRADRRARIEHVLSMTGLAAYAGRYPHELSGGQQQRVAIARAIAPRPAALLLDEPFSNLDVSLREQVRSEALGILRAAGASVILVTHDQDEAFVAAGRIAVMSNGRVHQVSTAEELYLRPATRFVAGFVGIANFLRTLARGGTASTEIGHFDVACDDGPCDVMLRPEQIEIAEPGTPATVVDREFHGHDWLYVLRTRTGTELRTISPSVAPLGVGANVSVRARVHAAPAFASEPATDLELV
jgi:iron(III) transport system ATP-binding protein